MCGCWSQTRSNISLNYFVEWQRRKRRACLRASLSIWRDCHFNETDLALHQQTVSDELFSLSSSSQRKWDEGLAEPVIYLLLKVFDPSLVDTLFSSCAFSSLIPTTVCQGALMASLSLSQTLRFPFFTTVVVEVKWKRMKEQFVLVYKHRLVLSSYYHTVVMQDSSDEIIAKGVFVCQIICDVRDLCVTSQFE